MRALRSQRGSVTLFATLAMLALVAASLGATVALVVAHAKRVSHQRDGLQALYLAEMGIEEIMGEWADGRGPADLERTVEREPDDEQRASGAEAPVERELGSGTDDRFVVGTYAATARRSGERLEITSTGTVKTLNGRLVVREVRVTCDRTSDGWAAETWERVP